MQLKYCYRCYYLIWTLGKYYCMRTEPYTYICTNDDYQVYEDPTHSADCFELASESEYMKFKNLKGE